MGEHTTFLIGLLCGVIGVLVDLDHVIAYYIGRSNRFLHTPLLIVSSIVICGALAYLGGLLLG